MIRRLAPSLLSALRIPLALVLYGLVVSGAWRLAVLTLIAAALSDLADGWLARRTDMRTRTGAYLDVGGDLLIVLGGFGALAVAGAMPRWLPFSLLAVFAQFLFTSRRGQPAYDPVGKYFGGFLYGALGVALALPDLAVAQAVTATVVVMIGVTLASRAVHLARAQGGPRLTAP